MPCASKTGTVLRASRLVLVIISLLLGASSEIYGETFHVFADGLGDYPTIQSAVDAGSDGDVIELGDGVFSGSGNRDIICDGKVLVIRSVSGDSSLTVIDCAGSESAPHRGFSVKGADFQEARLSLESVTIRNAYSDGPGGAVFIIGLMSDLTASNCAFLDNHADSGGAIWSSQFSSSTSISNCYFTRNTASQYGGAVYTGIDAYPSYLSCVFEDNSAGVGGGAMALVEGFFRQQVSDKGLKVNSRSNCQFLRNSAPNGGAIYAQVVNGYRFSDCLFKENTAGNGGAIYHAGYNTALTFIGCVFTRNAADQGGAVFIGNISGPPGEGDFSNYTSCTFTRNTAIQGGTFFVSEGESALIVTRSIITDGLQGEAVHCYAPSGLILSCCDIFNNEGGDWVGNLADQLSVRGNFSADPCYCDPEIDNYTLSDDSWCRPYQNPWGCEDLVGAYDSGCPAIGCSGVISDLVSGFDVQTREHDISLSWRLSVMIEATNLRIHGSAIGDEWDVFFVQGKSSEYFAIDTIGMKIMRSNPGAVVTYELRLSTPDGWTELHRQEVALDDAVPQSPFSLSSLPNPFNPSATITFRLSEPGRACLSVFDVFGRQVRTLVDTHMNSGPGSTEWNGTDDSGKFVASGTYLLRLETDQGVRTRKVMLAK